MTRKSIGFAGLGVLVIAGACTGGGAPNDFTLDPSGNAPTDPGTPSDPNAPPGNTSDPPFGDVAPPPGDRPPGGDDGTPLGDCTALCNEVAAACEPTADAEAIQECIDGCTDLPGRCFFFLGAFYRCAVDAGCSAESDVCGTRFREVIECIGPEPPPGGEGGQGGV